MERQLGQSRCGDYNWLCDGCVRKMKPSLAGYEIHIKAKCDQSIGDKCDECPTNSGEV